MVRARVRVCAKRKAAILKTMASCKRRLVASAKNYSYCFDSLNEDTMYVLNCGVERMPKQQFTTPNPTTPCRRTVCLSIGETSDDNVPSSITLPKHS